MKMVSIKTFFKIPYQLKGKQENTAVHFDASYAMFIITQSLLV